MSGIDPWIVVLAMIGGSVATLLLARFRLTRRERRRRASFRASARGDTVRYLGPQGWKVETRFPGLVLPFTRRDGRFTHVFEGAIEGPLGRRCRAWWGELTYESVTSAGHVTVSDAFVVVDVGPLVMPPVEIRPVELGDRIVGAVGLDDIHLESVEFSRKFNVLSADRRFAWALVEPPLMAALLDAPPGLSVAVGGSWVAVLRLVGGAVPAAFPFSGSGGGVTVADLDAIRDEAARVLALFPRTLMSTGAA
jgi:hypothetical protein